ncbi:hypothetical protein CBS9595_000011 [Malassezia furfur]|nr:hypothetical protein CBS9595_000011 [Malassezia furfur]
MAPNTVAVVGAGPVGCLTAIGFAERGYDVALYESQPESAFTKQPTSSQRSINLAVSVRGITALRAVGGAGDDQHPSIADRVLSEAVPMSARMIHVHDGDGHVRLDRQPYSTKGERAKLNWMLLQQAAEHPRVQLYFQHTLVHVHRAPDDDEVQLVFRVPDRMEPARATYALVAACDGVHSAVRTKVAPLARINTVQEYIDSGYVELRVPPGKSDSLSPAWQLSLSCLHIWPRHDYMLIALPNVDGSFTSTLFAPFRVFAEHCRDRASALAFFRANFPDALAVMDADELVEHLTSRMPSSLGSVQCTPMHAGSSVVLLGDAAHGMVPFYGQGLNCGLEDVRVFFEELDAALAAHGKLPDAQGVALRNYTAHRTADVRAIQLLAQENYTEMRSKVVRRDYQLRKWLDGVLSRTLPPGAWKSLYEMVTFSNMGYATARCTELRQQRILRDTLSAVGLTLLWGASWAVYRACRSA